MNTTVSIPAAFVFGLLSFFSPCVLPLVPAYLSFMSGASVEELMSARGSEAVRRTGLRSVLFVLGFSVVFIAMGATASSVGQFLVMRAQFLMRIAGVIVIIFGLHMLGILRIKALYAEKRFHARFERIGLVAPFLIGAMFAFGWTPCIGPVLGAILTLAMSSKTLWMGVGLLAVYSLGLGIPFLITGFATGATLKALGRFKPHFHKFEVASGILMIVVGVLIFTNSLQNPIGLFGKLLHHGS